MKRRVGTIIDQSPKIPPIHSNNNTSTEVTRKLKEYTSCQFSDNRTGENSTERHMLQIFRRHAQHNTTATKHLDESLQITFYETK